MGPVNKQIPPNCRIPKVWVSDGYSNWKKALGKDGAFKTHEKFEFHRLANTAYVSSSSSSESVMDMVSEQHIEEKKENRKALDLIFATIKLCGRQDFAIRGHTDENSNLIQMLNLFAITSSELKNCLRKKHRMQYLSHTIQNEIIARLGKATLDVLRKHINESDIYSIIVDETSDIATLEQVTYCIRSVHPDTLAVREDFVGFGATEKADGETLFRILKEKLFELKLPFEKIRGQAYDGAGAMRGHVKGLQSRVREVVPQALYCYCAGHALNLVVQDSIRKCSLAENAMTLVSSVVNYVKMSPKRLASFRAFMSEESASLRPLSSTRWVCRAPALNGFVQQYEALIGWYEMRMRDSDLTAEDRSKALATLNNMEMFSSYYMVRTLQNLFQLVHSFHTAVQSPDITITDAKSRLRTLKNLLESISENFLGAKQHFEKVVKEAEDFKLDSPKIPRGYGRRSRNCSSKCQTNPEVEIYYTDLFLQVFSDGAVSTSTRYNLECIETLEKLESVVLYKNSPYVKDIADFYYKDLDADNLKSQRGSFFAYVDYNNLTEKASSLRGIQGILAENSTLREVFRDYVMALRILLVLPATSCTAERSFSCLRRLKTWLRSTMGEGRLSSLALLSVHHDIADFLDLGRIVDDFIIGTTVRENTFFVKKRAI